MSLLTVLVEALAFAEALAEAFAEALAEAFAFAVAEALAEELAFVEAEAFERLVAEVFAWDVVVEAFAPSFDTDMNLLVVWEHLGYHIEGEERELRYLQFLRYRIEVSKREQRED